MSFVQKTVDSVKQKGVRYVGVSVINVLVGQTLIIVFHSVLHWNQTVANAAAVCVSAVPAYYLSRAWVWGKKGKSHFRKEVLPFWLFVLVGLVFSTVMVALSAQIFGINDTNPQDLSTFEKLLPNIVNMASFGILWVARFFLMEKLFEQHPELIEELVGEDFIEAVEGLEAVERAERRAAERAAARQAADS